MSYILRGIEKHIREAADHFPGIVLSGPRQTGKTTLFSHLFPSHLYVSLDRPILAEQAELDPESFLRNHPPPLIVDEVQYAPKLFRHLKSTIDASRTKKGQFLLTGSQKFNLMQNVGESLVGRVVLFELEGMSAKELINASIIQTMDTETIENLIVKGGFPELWADPKMRYERYLDSYIGTFLERDVKQVLNVGSLRDFERFMRACALRTGQILNKSDLARDVGVSVPTISGWISVLESLGQITLLEPWFGNLTKRLTKSPKLYLNDCAIACRLIGLSKHQISSYPQIGSLWETLVFSEIRKQLSFAGIHGKLWFYRDQSQIEVDFILEQGHELTLFECKWTDQPQVNAFKSLNKVEKILEHKGHYQIKKKTVIRRGDEIINFAENNSFSPLGAIL